MTFDAYSRCYTIDPTRSIMELPRDIDMRVYGGRSIGDNGRQIRVYFFPDGSSTGVRLKLLSVGLTCTVEVVPLTGDVSYEDCKS